MWRWSAAPPALGSGISGAFTSVVGVFAHGLVAGACAAESRASKDCRTDHPRLLEQALEGGSNAEREDLATPGFGLRIGEMCGRASGWIIHCMQWIGVFCCSHVEHVGFGGRHQFAN